MESSPSKRRKTSPTTSVPIDAPTTPSRIPVRKDGATTPRSRRPSFASPTKASLARHNPQLLRRTPPAAAVVAPPVAPGSRGRNLDEVFAKALEKARPSIEAGNSNLGDEGTDGSTTQENDPVDEHPYFNAQIRPTTRQFGGTLSAKPRRLSRSPFKQSPTKAFQTLVESGEINKANPFQKTGLRRSPVGGGSQETPVLQQSPVLNENTNPFQKTGLRRSPNISQEENGKMEENVLQAGTNPFSKKELRRSPIPSQEVTRENQLLRSSPVALQEGSLRHEIQQEGQQEISNPFKKRDLRRSPIVVQESIQQENIDPFNKRGLPRSPISSQPLATLRQGSVQPEVSTTPTEQPPRSLFVDNPQENDEDVDEQIQQQIEQEVELEVEQEDDAVLPQLREQKSSPKIVPRPILSDHPILTDPEFSRAVEDALQSSSPVQYQASSSSDSPNAFNISRVSETEAITHDSTSFSQAIEAAISSSPSRRSGRASRPTSIILSEPVELRQQPERHPSPDIPLLNSLVADSISQSQQPPLKPADSSLLRSPARRMRPASAANRLEPLRSSQLPKTRTRIRFTEPKEPELPPTPTQLGMDDPIVTTPPAGIHDTPGKKARRNKSLGERLKSSPLKPQDPPPQERDKRQSLETEIQPKFKSNTKQKELAQRRKSARFLTPTDPHASKKQERDALLKELQQLQADITLANKETERLHLRETQKSKPAGPGHAKDLLAVLLRSTAPELPSKPERNMTSIFKSIGSFLPFSSRRKHQSSIVAVEKRIPSHLPIALDDPLPYLQAFSPLIYISNITISTPEHDPDTSVSTLEVTALQHHIITASHPSGLFHARLGMTVDSSIPCIISLDILKLDANADKELGTFLRSRYDDSPLPNKDIGVVCWGMGRWVEVSLARARLWCTIEHEFGTPEARARSFQRNKKRKHAKTHDSASQDTNDEDTTRPVWTKKQLLPNMGRSALELVTDDVELRFEWNVGFDWTGEIESIISASARVPEDCKYCIFHRPEFCLLTDLVGKIADEGKSLGNIPVSFDRLVKQRGPLAAARIIIGLLLPAP